MSGEVDPGKERTVEDDMISDLANQFMADEDARVLARANATVPDTANNAGPGLTWSATGRIILRRSDVG